VCIYSIHVGSFQLPHLRGNEFHVVCVRPTLANKATATEVNFKSIRDNKLKRLVLAGRAPPALFQFYPPSAFVKRIDNGPQQCQVGFPGLSFCLAGKSREWKLGIHHNTSFTAGVVCINGYILIYVSTFSVSQHLYLFSGTPAVI